MNPKNFSVFEDLYELSQAADSLIEKTISESAFNENMFEETKKEIYKILLNKSPEKKKKSESKICFFRPQRKCCFDPFLEIRAHVHEKRNSESLKKSTTPTNSNKESKPSNETEVSGSFFFDKSKAEMQNAFNKELSTGDSCNESFHQSELDNEKIFETTFDKYSTPYNSKVCRNTYRKMPKKVMSCDFHEISPISNEFQTNPIRKEETILLSSESDSTSSKNVTIENIDILHDGKSLSSQAVDGKTKATPDKCFNKVNTSNLNKTFTLSSDSSKESISRKSLGSSSEICCDCSALSFNAKKQCKKKKCKSISQDYEKSSKNYSSVTSSGYVSGNPFEDNGSEKFPVNSKTKKSEKPLANSKQSAARDEQVVSIQYQNERNDRKSTSSETDIAFKEPHRCCEKAVNIPCEKLLLETIRENVPTFENQLLCSAEKKSFNTSHLSENLSSDSEKSRIEESKSEEAKHIPIEHYKKNFNRKYFANEEQSTHFRTFSAPVYRKVTTGRNLRPKTPIDIMNSSNHQSLKVKTEEKRKQREIRVQRTKERRERLELEREARMRDSEQKLKKRFQQHEEMLKQKTEAFKIKSRIREQRYSKRSVASTSSKDSKEDTTKDNDDFCRNAVNSGQKLYKESNDNCDVTPGENDLVSLDGNVGLNPEVSTKEEAILKGCEQTPVEFPVFSNNTMTVDTISLKKCQKLKFQKGSNPEHVTDHIKCTGFKSLKHSKKENILSQSDESKSSKLAETKENLEPPVKVKYVTPFAKRSKNIVKASKELSEFCNSKSSQNTYLLRSATKLKKGKVIDTIDFPQNKGNNSKHEISEGNEGNAEKHKILRNSSEAEKLCTNLCFKINKNKLKKDIKAPKKRHDYERNPGQSFTKPTRCKKFRLYDSSKESKIGDKVPDEIQKVISYEIPEEVEDSSEDTIDDSSKVPLWATGVYLKQALIQQLYHPPSIEDIFGILRKEPVNLPVLFGMDKPSYHHRTSSENWNLNETPK